jgi:hypothetical protein
MALLPLAAGSLHQFGKSPKARVTIQVLGINDAEAVASRESLREEDVRIDNPFAPRSRSALPVR